MKTKSSLVLITLLASSLPAQDSHFQATGPLDSASIPLYLRCCVTRVPLFHRPIKQAFRGTTIGAAVGIVAGLIVDVRRQEVFIPSAVIFGVLGSGAGLLSGTTVGIIQGIRLRNLPASEYPVRFKRCRFGYEYSFVSISPPSPEPHTMRAKGAEEFGMRLLYRPLSPEERIPDKMSIGFFTERWHGEGNYDGERCGWAFLYRVEATARYDLVDRNVAVPYWGAGAGYAWGYQRSGTYESGDFGCNCLNENQVRAPVLRAYFGSEFNCLDFFHADLNLGYELIGPYLSLRHKEIFPYWQNLLMELSFGMYLF